MGLIFLWHKSMGGSLCWWGVNFFNGTKAWVVACVGGGLIF